MGRIQSFKCINNMVKISHIFLNIKITFKVSFWNGKQNFDEYDTLIDTKQLICIFEGKEFIFERADEGLIEERWNFKDITLIENEKFVI